MIEDQGSTGATQTVLVACVDDDESIREALEGLLRSLGFAIETFESAEDFLRRGMLTDFACLVTDVRLKGISGLELQCRVAAAEHPIPTIIITAFDDLRLREQAMQGGAVCFLRKPIHRDDLISCIDSALKLTSRMGSA